MKRILLFILLMVTFNQAIAQSNVEFEDIALINKLLKADYTNKIAKDKNGKQIKIDINDNKEIDTLEALSVYALYLYPGEITNLKGIEKFKNLRNLDLSSNNLLNFENIDLPNLETLDLLDNDIIYLNIDNLQNLKVFSCQQNSLIELKINSLPNLEEINCSWNKLTKLNLKKLPQLNHLQISNNSVSGKLRLNHLTEIKTLWCSNNKINKLKINKLTSLKDLRIRNNKIKKIDKKLIRQLNIFECHNNKLNCIRK